MAYEKPLKLDMDDLYQEAVNFSSHIYRLYLLEPFESVRFPKLKRIACFASIRSERRFQKSLIAYRQVLLKSEASAANFKSPHTITSGLLYHGDTFS